MIRLKVREVAEAAGWNAGRLGRQARLSNAAIYGIWNGETTDPGVQTLGAIARALGVGVCDLIEEDGQEANLMPGDTIAERIDGPETEEELAVSLSAGPSMLLDALSPVEG